MLHDNLKGRVFAVLYFRCSVRLLSQCQKKKKPNRMLTTTVFVVSTILVLTVLAYHRPSDFRTIIPVTIQDDVEEPTERFIIAL